MGLKYFCNYRTLNTNELWRVEIDDPNYIVAPIEKLGAGGETCIIQPNGGDTLLEKFAIGSSAQIKLIFDDIEEVKQFQLIQDSTWTVRVYKSGVLNWKGYLISDGVQYPDSGVGFPITLTAVDGIESGQSVPFTNAEIGAITVDGQVGNVNSPLNWIRKCLVNNPLPIRWSCSMKSELYPTDDFLAGRGGIIPNYEIFASSRSETTNLWMIENIVKSLGCLFFQADGYWNIVSIKDLAQSDSLTFYTIDGSDLGVKTATSSVINLALTYPTPINESTTIMTQKPISKVKATYNHSMPTNIIPNGGFDILDSSNDTVFWGSSSTDITITPDVPINNRIEGRSAKFVNTGSAEGYVTFEVGGIQSIPLDANLLFKEMEWGFTFMPINYPTTTGDVINWDSEPLEVVVSYTGYENNEIKRFYLNEFGYWTGRELVDDIMSIYRLEFTSPTVCEIQFIGDPEEGQRFILQYWEDGLYNSFEVELPGSQTLFQAVTYIANEVGGTASGSTLTLTYTVAPLSFSASFSNRVEDLPKIPFTVDAMKNNDVATVSFQSKGNQGRVLFPNPRVLDAMRALDSGKLSLMIIIKAGQQVVFDDVYMNVSSDKEYWEISNGGTDGLQEYELDISSSFSGFMTSSYMNSFATSDLSMINTNGVDTGTLTEIFGKTALRMLSTPTSKIDVEFEGAFSMFNIIKKGTQRFLPLTISTNTETNSTTVTMFELSYNSVLVLDSKHLSTGNGGGVSGSGGSWSGGGGSGGATLLSELLDVSLSSPTNDQVLTFNGATGKWENKAFTFYTKTEINQFFAGTVAIAGYNKSTWDKIDNGGAINNTVAGLNTARTLWGQSFDGTANVTGSLTSVTDITGSGLITMDKVRALSNLSIPLSAPSSPVSGQVYLYYQEGAIITPPPPVISKLGDLLDVDTTGATDTFLYKKPDGTFGFKAGGGSGGDSYTKTEINNFFSGGVAITGYNKSTWDKVDSGSTLNNSISGNSNSTTNWGGFSANFNTTTTNFDYIAVRNLAAGQIQLATPASIKTVLGINDGSTLSNNISGSASSLTTARTIWGQSFNGTANITGALTSVTDITGSGLITMNGGRFMNNLSIPMSAPVSPVSGQTYLYYQEGAIITPAPPVISKLGDLIDVDTAGASDTFLYKKGDGTFGFKVAGGGTDSYTKTEINNFFSGGVAITGYNKSTWDKVDAGVTLNNNISGSASQWNGWTNNYTSEGATLAYLFGGDGTNSVQRYYTKSFIQSWLTLGSYAYRSSGLAELTGATFTGTVQAPFFNGQSGFYNSTNNVYILPLSNGWQVQSPAGQSVSRLAFRIGGDIIGYVGANNSGVIGGFQNASSNWVSYANSSGDWTATGKLIWGNSSFASGVHGIYNTALSGTVLIPKSGTSTDFLLTNAAGANVMNIQAGTTSVNFYGIAAAPTIIATQNLSIPTAPPVSPQANNVYLYAQGF